MGSGQPDYLILGLVLGLVALGLLLVYSSSFALGLLVFNDANYFVARQAIWAAIGIGLLVAMMRMDYRWLRTVSPLLMLVAIVGLMARDRTDGAVYIDFAAAEVGTTLVGDQLLEWELRGCVDEPMGNHHPQHAPHNSYECVHEDGPGRQEAATSPCRGGCRISRTGVVWDDIRSCHTLRCPGFPACSPRSV